ncbi:MAG: RNA methyltransferase [Patescibacteria group bacterium]
MINLLPPRRRGFCCIGLDNPKTDYNIGAVLRAAGVFGADMVAISGHRYKRAATDTMCAFRRLPFLQVDDLHDVIPYDCVPVAVELVDDATPLTTYKHPERAFYVFGAEDATLGTRVLSWCRDVIYIPTNGCLNLAACVNVILYDRMCKQDIGGFK